MAVGIYIYEAFRIAEGAIGLILTLSTAKLAFRLRSVLNYVSIAHLLILFPNFIILLSCIPSPLGYHKDGETNAWCSVCAFLTIASAFAYCGHSIMIPRAMYILISGRKTSTIMVSSLHAVGWIIGSWISIALMIKNKLRSYRGMYCLMSSEDFKMSLIVPELIIILQCFMISSYYYYLSWNRLRKLQASKTPLVRMRYKLNMSTNVLFTLLRDAFVSTTLFYALFFFVFLSALITASGVTPPMGYDMFASLVAKLQPSISALLIYHKMRQFATCPSEKFRGVYGPRKHHARVEHLIDGNDEEETHRMLYTKESPWHESSAETWDARNPNFSTTVVPAKRSDSNENERQHDEEAQEDEESGKKHSHDPSDSYSGDVSGEANSSTSSVDELADIPPKRRERDVRETLEVQKKQPGIGGRRNSQVIYKISPLV